MQENKELNKHIEAIGTWAAEDPKRVAFVVCGEMTDDGAGFSSVLVGRADRIARAVFGSVVEIKEEPFKQIIMLVAKAIENPLFASLLCAMASVDEPPENKSDLADALEGLVDAIAEKVCKNDWPRNPRADE